MLPASVAAASAKYRPGSEITRTPLETGKCCSRAALMEAPTASRVTPSTSWSAPENPPPISSKCISFRPNVSAKSKAARATETARLKDFGSVAPLPTWKEIPTTFKLRLAAVFNRCSTSCSSAPYLSPRGQRAAGSSARRRRMRCAPGKTRAILRNSSSLSKVVHLTFFTRAWSMWLGGLHALAYTIRSGGTPRANTLSISKGLAQSKPAPRAARSAKSAGSPLHLAA
mmetsp:Transcript_22750/g.27494  ORF Transcript_22750/g.27494 Transcript_22750/m.27494 type:complete len:228 (-) Transcript_22750:2425-3108(-)